jgi:biopolymer transport protein TolQ
VDPSVTVETGAAAASTPAGELSFTELVFNASPLVQLIMLILLLVSIASWTVIFLKYRQLKNARIATDSFEDKFWRGGNDMGSLYEELNRNREELIGSELIFLSGFREFVKLYEKSKGSADAKEMVMGVTYRSMKVALSREVEDLETHLPFLATVGSVSPYVGLFGTVWGIMHAFVALAAVKNATLAMVAPPIAEALIATAMGLFAAIPAVVAYNRFNTKVEKLENSYMNFMDELSTILNRKII